jgi:hypothetical protein
MYPGAQRDRAWYQPARVRAADGQRNLRVVPTEPLKFLCGFANLSLGPRAHPAKMLTWYPPQRRRAASGSFTRIKRAEQGSW